MRRKSPEGLGDVVVVVRELHLQRRLYFLVKVPFCEYPRLPLRVAREQTTLRLQLLAVEGLCALLKVSKYRYLKGLMTTYGPGARVGKIRKETTTPSLLPFVISVFIFGLCKQTLARGPSRMRVGETYRAVLLGAHLTEETAEGLLSS